MNYWKKSLSCWCLYFRRFAQSIGLLLVVVLCFFLQVFIPIYRGFERRWEFSRYINLSCLKLWFFTIDLLPDLIIVLWKTNFKSILFETEQGLQQYYCYSCLDVETSCRDGGCRGVRRVSGCTLRTLYFVNSGEVASGEMLLITIASDDLASDDVSSGALSSDSFLQTHFFRRILPDALSFK